MTHVTHQTPLDALCSRLTEVGDRRLNSPELLQVATDLSAGLARLGNTGDPRQALLSALVDELTARAAAPGPFELHTVQGAGGLQRVVVLEG
ncbi:MAG: hypothetical protein ACYCW6_28815 [Candidatus Xenobia bacterium]